MLGYMMSHGFTFFFISTFNVKYIGSGVLYFFISSMNLSHDPNCEFNRLTWLNHYSHTHKMLFIRIMFCFFFFQFTLHQTNLLLLLLLLLGFFLILSFNLILFWESCSIICFLKKLCWVIWCLMDLRFFFDFNLQR